MKARDLMTPSPTVVTPDEPVGHVARIMRDLNVGCVPVVDDRAHMHPVGVVTDRDLVVRCLAERHVRDCRAGEHMTEGMLAAVAPDADVAEVVRLMERDQLRRILVTDAGRLVGIIAQADLALKEGALQPLVVEEVLQMVSTPAVRLP